MRLRLRNIIVGWGRFWGFIPSSKAETALSELRIKQCAKCPFADRAKVLKLVGGHAKYEHQLVCSKCGCPCAQKSMVVEELCPVGKW